MSDFTEDIKRVAQQEHALQLPAFDLETAWALGSLARSLSIERGHKVAIEVRRGGKTAFLSALNGTTPSQLDWLRRKANTCEWFARSSYLTWMNLQAKGQTLAARHALVDADFAADGGAFPLSVAGTGVIGAFTISGLDMRADHELAVEVLCQHLKRDYAELKLA